MDRSTALVHRLRFLQLIQDLAKEDADIASQAVGIDALEMGESVDLLSNKLLQTRHSNVVKNGLKNTKRSKLSNFSDNHGNISVYIRNWDSQVNDSANRCHFTGNREKIITGRLFSTGTQSSNNQKKVRLPVGSVREQMHRDRVAKGQINAQMTSNSLENFVREPRQNCVASQEYEDPQGLVMNKKLRTLQNKHSQHTDSSEFVPENSSIINLPGVRQNSGTDISQFVSSSADEKAATVPCIPATNNKVIRVGRGPKRKVSVSVIGDTANHIKSLQSGSLPSTPNTTGFGSKNVSSDNPPLVPLVRSLSALDGDVSEVDLAATTSTGRRTLVRSSSRGAKNKPQSGDPIPPAIINKVAMAMQEIGKQSDFSSLKMSEKIERLTSTTDYLLTKVDSKPEICATDRDSNADANSFTNVDFPRSGMSTVSQSGLGELMNNNQIFLTLDTQREKIETDHATIGDQLLTLRGAVNKMLDEHSLIDYRHNQNSSFFQNCDGERKRTEKDFSTALHKEIKAVLETNTNTNSEGNKELELDRIKRKLKEQQRIEYDTFQRQKNDNNSFEDVGIYVGDLRKHSEQRAQKRHYRVIKDSEKRGMIPNITISRILAQQKEHSDIVSYNEKLWNSSHMTQYAFASRVTDVLLEDLLEEIAIEFEEIMEDYVSGLVYHELK